MRGNMVVVGIVVAAVFISGCATMSPGTKTGAGVGGVLGGVTGALIDKDNPWRGGIIGAAAGAIIGGTIGSMTDRATDEAAEKGQATEYTRTTADGSVETVRATPYGYTADGNYKLIKTQVVRNGVVVSEEVRRVPIN